VFVIMTTVSRSLECSVRTDGYGKRKLSATGRRKPQLSFDSRVLPTTVAQDSGTDHSLVSTAVPVRRDDQLRIHQASPAASAAGLRMTGRLPLTCPANNSIQPAANKPIDAFRDHPNGRHGTIQCGTREGHDRNADDM
jgi:hypothetical protein